MRLALVIAAIGSTLAGCQTAEQSYVNAQMTCQEAGLRPGTKTYGRCTNAAYRQNVNQSQQAANAVAVGAAVGLIGGAAIAANSGPRYYRPYGYRYGYGYCGRWGCR